MNDKFQILRDFAKSNDKSSKDIYQFVKEILDMNSAYAKENQQLKIQISAREKEYRKLENNWNKLKEYINKYIKYDKDGRKISKCLNAIVIMNKINKLEQGSDKDV